jgi:hypothetical protein
VGGRQTARGGTTDMVSDISDINAVVLKTILKVILAILAAFVWFDA